MNPAANNGKIIRSELECRLSRKGRQMGKIKLDLHDIYNKGLKIDAELNG